MPKYQVIADSGVQITDLGFFRKEQIFEAPSSWLPSRNGVLPLDAEAEALLKQAKAAYVAKVEARGGRGLTPEEKEELLRMPVRPGARPAESEMQVASKVAAGAPLKETDHTAAHEAKHGKGGRAADKT